MVHDDEILRLVRTASPVPTLDHVDADDLTLLRELVGQGRSAMTTPIQEKPTGSFPPLSRKRAWQKPAFVFALAMAVVLVVFGVTVLLLGGAEDIAPADEPTPIVTQTTPLRIPEEIAVPSPPPEAAMVGPEWSRVFDGGRHVLRVAASDHGVFASGDGGIWHSDDGIGWQNVVSKDTTVTALGAGTGGAVGFGICPSVGMGFCDLVSNWYTRDGVTWVEQRAAPLDAGEFAQVFGMVEEPGEGRFFAVGQNDAARAAVWSGEASGYWSLGFEHPADNSAMVNVVRYDDGYIAVGRTSRAIGDAEVGVAAVWLHEEGDWTADGMRWTLVSDDLSVFGPTVDAPVEPARWRANDAVAGDFGMVVVGEVSYGTGPYVNHAAVWYSSDGGQAWSLIEDSAQFENDGWIAGVTHTPEGLVAVGHFDGKGAMWTSQDGIAWNLANLDDSVFGSSFASYDIVLDDSVLYVAGKDSGAGGIWARTISN